MRNTQHAKVISTWIYACTHQADSIRPSAWGQTQYSSSRLVCEFHLQHTKTWICKVSV